MAHVLHSRAYAFVVASMFLLLQQIKPISFLFQHVDSLPAIFLAFIKIDGLPLQKLQQGTVWGAEERHEA